MSRKCASDVLAPIQKFEFVEPGGRPADERARGKCRGDALDVRGQAAHQRVGEESLERLRLRSSALAHVAVLDGLHGPEFPNLGQLLLSGKALPNDAVHVGVAGKRWSARIFPTQVPQPRRRSAPKREIDLS